MKLIDFLGPMFVLHPETRKKYKAVARDGNGSMTLGHSVVYDKELDGYRVQKSELSVSDGEYYDCVLVEVDTEEGRVTRAAIARQMDRHIYLVGVEKYKVLLSEENTKDSFSFWFREV